MKQLNVKNLSFSYDQKTMAVDAVSFSVKKGQYVSIIGHNGSGKSTIAKLIIGLLEGTPESIQIDDLTLNTDNVYDMREKIAIVFQNPDNQFIGSTVRDDIAFGLENRLIDPKEMDEIIETYASRVGMSAYLEHEPTKLSGGQKQRVAIAGALAMHPELLVLDEATSMLDPKGRREVNALVHELHENNEMTILSITHDIEEVTLSDYVLVMNEGKLVMQGTPQEILNQTQKLIDMSLDIPFSAKVYESLKNQGLNPDFSYDIEKVVASLWQ